MLKRLTVRDLIEELSKHPPETKIYRPSGCSQSISGIRQVQVVPSTSIQSLKYDGRSEMVILMS